MNLEIDEMIELSKKNLHEENLEYLEKVFWNFYPHEITWNEMDKTVRNSMNKIGRILVQNAKLKPSDLQDA